MLDFLFYVVAGAGVGLAVGLTGVGGGSLMTPILIMTGVPSKIAIGTDLLYAAFTKSGAMLTHHRAGNVEWKVVFAMSAGSIPASLLTTLLLKSWIASSVDYETVLTQALGFMLVATACVVLLRSYSKQPKAAVHETVRRKAHLISFSSGVLLGVFVTLSSVGAGAFGAAILLYLYPRLKTVQVVGTDIAHAVPLTLVAGLGHLSNGHVDFMLLAGLLAGSLPAVHFASKYAARIPNHILRPILGSILFVIGIKFLFFH